MSYGRITCASTAIRNTCPMKKQNQCVSITRVLRVIPKVVVKLFVSPLDESEIISMVILLSSADSFKKGCCQLQAKVCAQITG